MKTLSIVLPATLLALAGAAHAADLNDGLGAADYLRRAKAEAVAETAATDLSADVAVKMRVGGDGRLYGAEIVKSSGSPETDRKVARALRFTRVPDPPTWLVAGAVTLALGPQHMAAAPGR